MNKRFVHLHLHSEYSISDGIVRIPHLVDAAARAQQPAVAITDRNNLFAMVRFYRAAIGKGIKPIIGSELLLENDADASQPFRLLLLCQDRDGYRNLARLLTRMYQEGQSGSRPQLRQAWLTGNVQGLICLSGGWQGDIGQAVLNGRDEDARHCLERWLDIFQDRFYLQVSRTGRAGEEEYLHGAVNLAHGHGVPLVATNDVCFIHQADFEAHEARTCIQDGRVLSDERRPRRYSDQQYLKSAEEMHELFSDLPQALENSLLIAQRCNLELELGKYYLPDFPLPGGHSLDEWFRQQAEAGLDDHLAAVRARGTELPEPEAEYRQRLETEIGVIVKMGFPGYFLIVADFIRWAKKNGIPVGPGRGSGAGSLVAFALGITELDPIQHELLFERFLNPERVSMPDFDVDFCMDRRDDVIDYVAQRYGRDRVSQIITFGTMAAKAVVRDVGRVLGHPYGFVDQIAKLIPFELNITLDKALEDDATLRERYEQDDDVHALIELARKLEGLTRNAGKHAGGVVIAPEALTEFMPLYCEKDATATVTQFDKDDVEALGLVKFDFLGLRTLTIIDWAVAAINAGVEPGREVDIRNIPMHDPQTFALLKRCETTAVFQLESRGMKDLIKRLQPDCFDEITALVALFRPGPLQSGMVDDFINRKHGHAKIEYPHPDLAPILEPTYGIILYQEQVMQAAQVLSGYTLGAADILRRAMGKKKPAEMAKQRTVFVDGAVQRGVQEKTASSIFDLIEKFAGYGFNKSHSAAYALIAYQTAWLKAHYPSAFMAAVLTADMDNTDKVVMLIDECAAMNLSVLPPDVNHCVYAFTHADDTTIRYGLGAIKGVGRAAIEHIVEERELNGPFRELFDFTMRIDTRKVNRRALEALIRSGAMDDLGPGRAPQIAVLESALRAAEQHDRNSRTGQDDLFGLGAGAPESATGGAAPVNVFPDVPQWHEEQRLEGEMETLGLYLTGHPIRQYEDEISDIVSCRLVDIGPARDGNIRVCGLVSMIRKMNSRRGQMAFITLDDRTARVEVTVYSDIYQESRALLTRNRILVVEGTVSTDERSGAEVVTANRIQDLEQARETYARCMLVELNPSQAGNGMVDALRSTLDPYCGGSLPISIGYAGQSATARISLGDKWRVRPANELLRRLGELVGEGNVTLVYP